PSGCGKTTTLRIVAGLEAPDAGGTVHFGDEDVTARPIERRRVGMVFQSYALFPNLSVRGNVEYGLRIQRRQNGLSDTQISARANTLLE
ncbi:ATP-binding cassette domain-containing protein, partial [Stenotrophomonas maltophilia]